MNLTEEGTLSIDALKDIAKSLGREIEVNEKRYKSNRPLRHPRFRDEVYISKNEKDPNVFVSVYDSFYTNPDVTIFSGMVTPFPFSRASSFVIRKRYIFDVFSSKRTFKTGNRSFDKQAFVQGNDRTLMAKIIGDIKFQQLVLESFQLCPTMKVSLNHKQFSFVPVLEGESQFSFYDDQKWFMDKEQIQQLFKLLEKFQSVIR